MWRRAGQAGFSAWGFGTRPVTLLPHEESHQPSIRKRGRQSMRTPVTFQDYAHLSLGSERRCSRYHQFVGSRWCQLRRSELLRWKKDVAEERLQAGVPPVGRPNDLWKGSQLLLESA